MHDGRDLENRLRRLAADLALGPEDRAALATLRQSGDPARRRRRWLRGASVPVALAAVVAAGAVAFASSPLGVILRFHPVDTRNGGSVVIGRANLAQQCPPPDPSSLADVRQRAGFTVLTADAPGVTLAQARYQPRCGAAGDFAELAYEDRGASFSLIESRAAPGPLKVDIKDGGQSSWHVIRVDGNDYAVYQDHAGAVWVADFQRDGTRVSMTIGAKGGPDRPISLAEFQDLVRHIG